MYDVFINVSYVDVENVGVNCLICIDREVFYLVIIDMNGLGLDFDEI